MHASVFLAHGALGIWDEVIFLSIAAIFLVMMGISWVRSRNTAPDFKNTSPLPSDDNTSSDSDSPSHFRLD